MGKNTLRGLYILLLVSLLSIENGFAQCPTVNETTQSFCDTEEATIADLVAIDNGGGLNWYGSSTSTAPLVSTSPLQNGVTYYADNSSGNCGTRTAVNVIVYTTPTGINFQGFCITNSLAPLPTLDDLFVVGTNIQWYDAAVDGTLLPSTTTLVNNTVYYASQTPTGLGCETTRFAILVSLVDVSTAPSGSTEQYFCDDSSNPPTIGDLVASGNNNWYATLTSTVPLSSTQVLVDGETYYSTYVAPPCESETRLPVTVTIYPENFAGDDNTIIICSNDIMSTGSVDLFASLAGTPDIGGSWSGPLPVSGGVVDITSMTMGDSFDFTYTASNSVNCPSDTAVVTLYVPDDPDSGTAGSITLCSYDPTVDLFTLLGGTPETGGVWTPALNSGTNVFDPSIDPSATYTYTVTSPGNCSQSSTNVIVEVIYDVNSGLYTGTQDICNTDGTFDLFTLLDGSEDTGGTWSVIGGATVSNPINIASFTEGNYSYTYEVTNSCFSSSTDVTFHISNPLSSGTFTGTQDVCVTDGTFDLFNLLDGSEDSGGVWTDSASNVISNIVDISAYTAGIYNFEYSITNVCGTFSTAVILQVSTPLSAGNFTGTMVNCSSTGMFDLSDLLDGTQDAGGIWLDSSNNTISNPIDVATYVAGSYSYTYSVTNVCGTDTEDVTIVFPDTPDAGIDGSIELCITDAPIDLFNILTGTPDSGGVWTPTLNSGTGLFDPSVDSTGAYIYTVTSSGDCLQDAATVNVVVHPLPVSGTFTGVQEICNASGNFNLVSLLDGSQDAGGTWTDSSNTTVSNILDLNLLSTGTYTYTYTVTNFCTTVSTDVTFVLVDTLSAGNFTGLQDVCITDGTFDLSSLLDGSQDLGGVWEDASSTIVTNPLDISILILGNHTYTYAVTNSCGTFSTDVTFSLFDQPSSGVFTGVQENCTSAGVYDLFTLLDGTEDAGGQWFDSSNNAVTSTIDVSGFSAGTYNYYYEVTNVCGTTSTTVTLSFANQPDAGTNASIGFCPADAASDLFNALGGTPEAGGTWSPALASGTGFFDPGLDAAGTYTYTVTTTAGCLQSSANVTVSILPLPNAGVFTGIQQACSNTGTFDLFTLLDGSQDAGGVWEDSGSSSVTSLLDISSYSNGVYTFTYTVTNTCDVATTDVTLEIITNPESGVFVGSTAVCPSAGTFDLTTLLDGSQNLGGTWSDTNGTVINPIDVSTFIGGSYDYTYEVTNLCGTASTTVTFTVPDMVDAGVDATFDICATGIATDLFSELGGTPETGGIWSPALSSGTGVFDPALDAAGVYTYTVTSAGACYQASASVTVTISGAPSSGVFTGSQEVCPSIGTFDLNLLLDGSQDTSGDWYEAGTTTIIVNPLDVSAFTTGTYSYDYSVSNGCGASTTSVSFVVPSVPDAGSDGGADFCLNGTGDDLFNYLAGTPETGGTWSPALASGTGVFDPTVDTAGVYTYTVASSSGCFQSSANVTVTMSNTAPHSGVFLGVEDVCTSVGTFDLITLLSGYSSTTGTWTDGSGNIITNPIDVSTYATGVYDFTYEITNSCGTSSVDAQINVFGDVNLSSSDLMVQSPVCYGDYATVTITNGTMLDGDYNISYSLSGANTVATQVTLVTMASGTGQFTISGATYLTTSGTTTVTIENIEYVSVAGCAFNSVGVSIDMEVSDLLDIDDSQISIDSICFGEDGIVELTGLSIPDGNYELTYLLESSSSLGIYTGSVTVTSGIGTLIIPAANILDNDDVYSFEINVIFNVDTGCSNINEDAAALFNVYPVIDINVNLTKLTADETCLNSDNVVTIINTSVPDNDYSISYELSGAVSYTETGIDVTFVNGETTFVIDGSVLNTGGTVSVLLTTLEYVGGQCPVTFTNIATTTFDVLDAELPELIYEGNVFCIQDYPVITVADLSNNVDTPLDNVIWYETETGTTILDPSTVLADGQIVYGVYEMYAACTDVGRLEVTIEEDFCDIIIPDGFSANNDGINETFEIKEIRTYYPDFQIEIFNRYGTIVYRGNYDTPDWDGTATEGGIVIGSNKLPAGVYFYILKLHDEENRVIQGRLFLNR
ncbi:protein of unknown function precursor; adhesin [Neptunitalea chrysea]|uniref:Gliding motility-associated C-terminal domain-containing protein n=1 Tax=Neptunitalea chrysea TaxID=1647581 RepID=A0A9W6B6Y0_9FLAO|nr:gliding motility-associated C-terminal domain-containing protein [Neptunitalea chrysea]GLB52379.1 protein of unknown function precursor; adhesin [Neptunitalea chrysea]